ncbi:winged helix-turn-helix domain-containing protein [Oribacterium parvum]
MLTDRKHILLLLKENPSLTQAELSGMMNKSRRAVHKIGGKHGFNGKERTPGKK